MEEHETETEISKKYYFTFGAAHPFARNYFVIEGTFDEARDKMFSIFGNSWAFQYGYDDGWLVENNEHSKLVTQAEKWNLKEIRFVVVED